MVILGIIRFLLFVICLVSIGYLFWTLRLAFSFYGRLRNARKTIPEKLPPVSQLKPVHSVESWTDECLATFCQQKGIQHEVLFVANNSFEPAVELAKKFPSRFSEVPIQVFHNPPQIGTNPKVNNLIEANKHSRFPILCISDSDVRVHPEFLQTLVSELDDLTIGMVTCLYYLSEPKTFANQLETVWVNVDFFTSVLAAEKIEGISFGLGAVMLVPKDAIQRIGGLSKIADYLADDYQLGNRIWKAGYTIRLSREIVEIPVVPQSLRDVFQHQLRWATTYRVCRPKGYFLSLFTQSTVLSTFLVLVWPTALVPWILFGTALMVRGMQAVYCDLAAFKNGRKDWKKAGISWIKDYIHFAVWAMSFFTRTLHWGKAQFKITKEGKIQYY